MRYITIEKSMFSKKFVGFTDTILLSTGRYFLRWTFLTFMDQYDRDILDRLFWTFMMFNLFTSFKIERHAFVKLNYQFY